MRFVQFFKKSDPCQLVVGIRNGSHVIRLDSITKGIPNNLVELIHKHGDFLESLENLELDSELERIPMDQLQLTAPIQSPDKVICVGMNYKDHCEEQNVPVPTEPIFFSKFPSNLIGPFDPIPYPSITKQLDYEVELAFIIGKKGKDIPAQNAMDYVFGYTTAHDVSARDWQFSKNGGQWLLGKCMDGFCPIGPEVVTKAELTDPHSLRIQCKVNGDVKQDSNTSQLVHRIDGIIAYISKVVTLYPGDIILTGTPPGVGVFRKPQFFLQRGDIVECEIEKIGTIRNTVI